jgi:predicted AAA+ superfamily ATPase
MKIKRNVFNKLYGEVTEPEISILLGARQVGKTTLLKQLEERAKKDGYITSYFNLESSTDLARLGGNDRAVVTTIVSSGKVVFIDEFHYLKNASKIFKEIYDTTKNIKIYASGSSSLDIHKHLKESLAGRYRKTIVFPLTMDELSQVYKDSIGVYRSWGGMPGLLHRKTKADKMELLENIVSTYITKDIKGLIKEENIRAFNSMLYALAQNQGSLTVASNIARDSGIAESTASIYLEMMAQTYVCYQIGSYSTNLANELKKSKKCYLFDIGIRNALLKDFSEIDKRDDKGTINESMVAQHLISLLQPNMELHFWRTKKGDEVDFILTCDRKPIPIEVKSLAKEKTIPDGMRAFFRTYPKTKYGVIFNETTDASFEYEKKKICFVPFHKMQMIRSMLTREFRS